MVELEPITRNHDMFLFFKQLIAFRKEHPLFRRASEGTPKNYPAVSLHGINPWHLTLLMAIVLSALC